MEAMIESWRAEWDNLTSLAPRIVAALLTLVLLILLGRLCGRLIVRLLERGQLTRTHLHFFKNLTTWVFALFGLVISLNLLGLQSAAAGLMAGGGVTAIVLGFALRGIGENFLAGFFLAFSRPFGVGDLIQSGEFRGQVQSIELRSTHIRTAEGSDVFIPSMQIFNQPLVNFTRDGLRRLSFVIGLDYAEDTERARSLLLDAIKGLSPILPKPGSMVTVSSLLPQYQELEVSFWVDTFAPGVSVQTVRSQVMERCRKTLRSEGFTLSSEVVAGLSLDVPRPLRVQLGSQPQEDANPF